MLIKPRFKESFTLVPVGQDLLFALDEHQHLVFQGAVYVELATLLDGTQTFGDLLARLRKVVSVSSLYRALNTLEVRGCTVEADGCPAPPNAAFWDSLGADPVALTRQLHTVSVSVEAIGGLDSSVASAMSAALASLGIPTDNTPGSGADSLRVVICDDYLSPRLAEINAEALGTGRPWLLIKPVGTVLWIGPLIRPGETACWSCLEQRQRANREVEGFILARVPDGVPFDRSRGRLPSTVDAGIQLSAVEIARSLLCELPAGHPWAARSTLEGRILTLDLTDVSYDEHTVVRRPQCPACGDPGVLAPRPIAPGDVPKARFGSERHRAVSPEETFARYEHHISRISGVVTSLQSRGEGDDGLVYNYVCGHYFPVLVDEMARLLLHTDSRSGGKGRSRIQAKTSAICEAIERYSGVFWGEEEVIRGSAAELGPDAIPIRDLALFSEAQYATRKTWNQSCSSETQMVPDPVADDVTIGWTRAWSLTEERFRLLPMAYCYYGFRDMGHFFTRSDSNGNAAGNTVEEAILQGFLELVERDCVALWWYNRLRRPRVDVATFELPYWSQMRSHYAELGRDLCVLDVTSDLGVPAFTVVSRREGRPIEDIIVGFSAHLDPATALSRALAEANQYLPILSTSRPDGTTLYRLPDPESIRWWKTATYAAEPWLTPDEQAPVRVRSDYEDLSSRDLGADVRTCLKLAAGHNLDVLVVNQTRPDIGLPVVKVVVPGLRHFWRRLAPGRLYDVPVQMGWLDTPHEESAMNPISCFV